MRPAEHRRRHAALALMAHAIIRTRGTDPASVKDCNERFTRARDWLLHEPATDIVRPGVALSAAEVDALREEALDALRENCRVCGLCVRLGIAPP